MNNAMPEDVSEKWLLVAAREIAAGNVQPVTVTGYNDDVITNTLVITTSAGRIEIPVTMTQAQGDAIGNALYAARGQQIAITLEDEDGWGIGVVGTFVDTEDPGMEGL
jgi:hypothetical protein